MSAGEPLVVGNSMVIKKIYTQHLKRRWLCAMMLIKIAFNRYL